MKKKNILLLVTGSVSAYKAADIASAFKKNGCVVDVVITEAAKQFVTETALSSIVLPDGAVYDDYDFFNNTTNSILHIELTKQADAIIVAPMTANTLSKMCSGIADNLVSSILLVANGMKKDIFLCPAMNENMLNSDIIQKHILRLKNKQIFSQNNIVFIEPEVGELACGEVGKGKLAKTKDIVESVLNTKIIVDNNSECKKSNKKDLVRIHFDSLNQTTNLNVLSISTDGKNQYYVNDDSYFSLPFGCSNVKSYSTTYRGEHLYKIDYSQYNAVLFCLPIKTNNAKTNIETPAMKELISLTEHIRNNYPKVQIVTTFKYDKIEFRNELSSIILDLIQLDIIRTHSNLSIVINEASGDSKPTRMKYVFDALGNIYKKSKNISNIYEAVFERLLYLKNNTSRKSFEIKYDYIFDSVPEEDYKQLVLSLQSISNILSIKAERNISYSLDNTNYFGNISLRCKSCPEAMWISERSLDKHAWLSPFSFCYIIKDVCKTLDKNNKQKPSKDSGIYQKLYKEFPEYNVIYHNHFYINNDVLCGTTKNILPCGVLEEFDSISNTALHNLDVTAVNLKGHGCVIMAKNLDLLKEYLESNKKYLKYKEVEFHEKESKNY